ncbi:MAG: O-antigen ligase family protein [Solirubrobacteraceae bacterium]
MLGSPESVAIPAAARSRRLARIDGTLASTVILAACLVLYLGFQGGGYDVVISSQIGLILWWIVLIGAVWGLFPAVRPSRSAWIALGLFGGFVAWTALASTWSLSSERSLQSLARVSTYLGVLVLALAIHRDRERAVRHTVTAVAVAITILAGFAVVSRLVPGAFPASHVTAGFLGIAQQRLGWPLNYWNGLAALVALGLPLLLSLATSARTLLGQAAAAAGIPLLALCEYLTFSRGGAISSAVALLAFFALAPDRFAKLATICTTAAASAILIAATVHRGALEHGLTNSVASAQGKQVLLALILVCAGVGLVQTGIGLAVRHGTPPRLLVVPPRRARLILAGGVVLLIAIALAASAPSRLSHAWNDFKRNGNSSAQASGPGRLTSFNGEGRYTYWQVATNASANDRLQGTGPGTFQLDWLPRAPIYSPVINAHSLYVETLAEEGVIGLALLAGSFALFLAVGVRLVIRSRYEARTRAAGATAALLALMVSAIADWTWQLPVLPAAFLLLAAAMLAPAAPDVSVRKLGRGAPSTDGTGADGWQSRFGGLITRIGLAVVAAACLVGVGIPLATASDVRQSQAAVAAGDLPAALADARSAARVEPGASSPQLQLALVLELQHDYPAAVAAATKATRNEAQNWANWLVLSRLEAEAGDVRQSVIAYRRARSLNPRSPLFR